MDYINIVIGSGLLVISLVLIFGRGSILVAGYNTLSDEEKAKYNEEKLCRAVGTAILIIGIMLIMLGIFHRTLVFVISVIVNAAALLIMYIYINKKCKIK